MIDLFCLKTVIPKNQNWPRCLCMGTESLALTKCRFSLKAKAFTFRYSASCESMICILHEQLKVSPLIGQS